MSCLLAGLHFAVLGMKSSSGPLLQAGVWARICAGEQQNPQKPMGEFLQAWEAQNTRESSQEAWEEDFSGPGEGCDRGDSSLWPGTSMCDKDSSCHPLLGCLEQNRSFFQSGVVSKGTEASSSPSPQEGSLCCACRPLTTLPEMRLHRLPALKFCSILNPL